MITWLRGALAVVVAIGCGASSAIGAPTAHAATTVTLQNFNSSGGQLKRYDTDGNAIDAHDGQITQFGGTYYLYGTSYNCGWYWLHATPSWCGFKVYTSTDLAHWVDRGRLFDPTSSGWSSQCVSSGTTYGCGRAKVLYSPATRQYVLWFYESSHEAVATSSSPTGPFTFQHFASLAQPTPGDFNLFTDYDGTGYIIYASESNNHAMYVDKLNSNYDDSTGISAYVGAQGVEAPSLFVRGSTYYALYGPTCAFCSGTATDYRTASSPLGPWSSETQISGNSCGGQPQNVFPITNGGSSTTWTFLYSSDLFNGSYNEALANFYWRPLSFDSAGNINALTCDNPSVDVIGPLSSDNIIANGDQGDQAAGFQDLTADINSSGSSRAQTFTNGRSGMLSGVTVTAYQKDLPSNPSVGTNQPLTIAVYSVGADGFPSAALYSADIPVSSVGWSPRNITIDPNIAVNAGEQLAIVVSSSTTSGVYGLQYNDTNPYAGGNELYAPYGSGAWTQEPGRDIKFYTQIN